MTRPIITFAFASLALATQPVAVLAQAVVQPLGPTDADRLAAAMRRLAVNASDLSALLEAGEWSLKLGDLSGAASLFARAERIDPRNGRVKAGMGAILIRSERPGEALRYFRMAEELGLSPVSYAADRGLAYDLVGEQERAQRDYRLALRISPTDETVRRYALSLGISGKRDLALAQLTPLLRQTDRGAWRARAFVLAMTGDTAGASNIATTMMPPGMASGLLPFFQRLASLPPVDRAFAVHFGEVRATPERLADARLTPAMAALGPDPDAPRVALAAAQPAAPAQQNRKDRRSRRERRAEAVLAAQQLHPQLLPQLQPQPGPQLPAVAANAAYPRQPAILPGATQLARQPQPAAPEPLRPAIQPVPVRGDQSVPVARATPSPAAAGGGVAVPPRVLARSTAAPVVLASTAPVPSLAVRGVSPTSAPAPVLPLPVAPLSPSPATVGASSPAGVVRVTAAASAGTTPAPLPVAPVAATVGASPTPTSPIATAVSLGAARTEGQPVVPSSAPVVAAAAEQTAAGVAALRVSTGGIAAAPAGAGTTVERAAAPAVDTVAAVATPTITSVAVPPSAVAAEAPPALPTPSARIGEDTILAKIVANLSIPAAELGITAPVRPSVERASTTPGEAASLPATAVAATASRPAGEVSSDPKSRARAHAAAEGRGAADGGESATARRPLGKAAVARRAVVDEADREVGAVKVAGASRAAGKRVASSGKKGSNEAVDLADDAAKPDKSKKLAGARPAIDARAAATKAAAKALADKAAADDRKASRANPERIWVQVAGGASADDLPKAWAAAKAKDPASFAGRTGYTTPLRATNRVLAGPFKTDAEARRFVNQLARKGVSAFTFTSERGQSVARLPSE